MFHLIRTRYTIKVFLFLSQFYFNFILNYVCSLIPNLILFSPLSRLNSFLNKVTLHFPTLLPYDVLLVRNLIVIVDYNDFRPLFVQLYQTISVTEQRFMNEYRHWMVAWFRSSNEYALKASICMRDAYLNTRIPIILALKILSIPCTGHFASDCRLD